MARRPEKMSYLRPSRRRFSYKTHVAPWLEVAPPVDLAPQPPRVDPLAATFAPPHPVRQAFGLPVEGLKSVDVGWRIDPAGDQLAPWAVPMWGTHLLVAGMTGYGKTRFYLSLARGMAPWINDGTVQVWAFDPKRVGLGIIRPMCARMWTPRGERGDEWGEGAARLLTEAVEEMERRLDHMDDNSETEHRPTPDHPHIIILVDEIARLRRAKSKSIRDSMNDSLNILIEEGRAPAVSVVIATQDPRANVIGEMREGIPHRIAFKLGHANQCDMVLGEGAREAGARADLIASPGVAYMRIGDEGQPVRVKSHMLDNAAAKQLAADFPAPKKESN